MRYVNIKMFFVSLFLYFFKISMAGTCEELCPYEIALDGRDWGMRGRGLRPHLCTTVWTLACEMGSEKSCVRRALSVKGNAWFHFIQGFPKRHDSAVKRNAFDSVLIRWMNLEPITQNKANQKEKDDIIY